MDMRDFLRGIFGIPSPEAGNVPSTWSSGGPSRNNQVPDYSPPSMDIPEEMDDFSEVIGTRKPGLIFGDMFSVMENMFKDMEQSMREMEQDFNNIEFSFMDQHGSSEFPTLGGFGIDRDTTTSDDLPHLPSGNRECENIRDLVLKKDQQPGGKSEKIDKDLDDLYSSSKLNLSDLPLVRKNFDESSAAIKDRSASLFGKPSFERVYSTYSFKNGKWEGKTIREDERGQEVTTYFSDANGENTQKEFIPNRKSDTLESSIETNQNNRYSPLHFPKSLFDRFFNLKS